MTTLLEAAKTLIKVLELEKSQIVLSMASGRALEELEQAIEREKAMSPKPVSGTSSGRHCGACKHDIHPMPARCYKCGVGDLSNWEPKP